MHITFGLRRQDIVQGHPQVKEFLESWPALRLESQVFAKFHCITNVNLHNRLIHTTTGVLVQAEGLTDRQDCAGDPKDL
ncbi:hypothetical protein L3Q82_008875 [Scortum barcoo]|uniref:Uncharacterized protein n=1 Tax=Scortum barcoo TaxID=214431 RepID=A0ACB8XCP1_9TELE|nr:hypothetical protein L3Q82_008875 [Scortum barcoo]